jgi:hypothetical protein
MQFNDKAAFQLARQSIQTFMWDVSQISAQSCHSENMTPEMNEDRSVIHHFYIVQIRDSLSLQNYETHMSMAIHKFREFLEATGYVKQCNLQKQNLIPPVTPASTTTNNDKAQPSLSSPQHLS